MNRRLLFPSVGWLVVASGLVALMTAPAPASSEVVALGPETTVRRFEKPLKKDLSIPFSLATHNDGSFAVAWGEGDFGVRKILMRRFDGLGGFERPLVIDAVQPDLNDLSMASDLQGGVVVVWSRAVSQVAARFVPSPSGDGPLGPVLTVMQNGRDSTVARVGGGRFALGARVLDAADSGSHYVAVQFNRAGPIAGSDVLFGFRSAAPPVVAAGPAGDLAVVAVRYTVIEQEGKLPRTDADVVGERVAAGGEGPGRRFAVSTVNRDIYDTDPKAALLGNGDLVVVWARTTPDRAVLMRRFDARGLPRTPILRIASGGGGFVGNPHVAADRFGRIVVVWLGEEGISGQRFDAAGRAIGEPFRVSQVSSGVPKLSLAANGAYFNVAWRREAPGGYHLVVRRFAVN